MFHNDCQLHGNPLCQIALKWLLVDYVFQTKNILRPCWTLMLSGGEKRRMNTFYDCREMCWWLHAAPPAPVYTQSVVVWWTWVAGSVTRDALTMALFPHTAPWVKHRFQIPLCAVTFSLCPCDFGQCTCFTVFDKWWFWIQIESLVNWITFSG